MTVTNVHQDSEALTLSISSHFGAAIDQVWELWADPRKLERWWGPPTHPATFVDHDLGPGGTVSYFMTGPDGERFYGWWRVLEVRAPLSLRFEDGFADDAGRPNPTLPTTMAQVTLSEHPEGGTTMVIESTFPSREAMQQMVDMGMVEGMKLALGQIDDILRGVWSER
jgi:uncharacterized protein YndB with AHSA1/START domain